MNESSHRLSFKMTRLYVSFRVAARNLLRLKTRRRGQNVSGLYPFDEGMLKIISFVVESLEAEIKVGVPVESRWTMQNSRR
jgi:hypothetical protein